MQMKFQVTENIVFLFFFWKASKFILKLCFWKLCLQCGSIDRTEKETYGNDNRYPVCYLARSYQSKHVFPRSTQLLPVYGAYPAVCEWMKSVQERFVQLKIIFVIRQTHKKTTKKCCHGQGLLGRPQASLSLIFPPHATTGSSLCWLFLNT